MKVRSLDSILRILLSPPIRDHACFSAAAYTAAAIDYVRSLRAESGRSHKFMREQLWHCN
jgi:hypothetical protein